MRVFTRAYELLGFIRHPFGVNFFQKPDFSLSVLSSSALFALCDSDAFVKVTTELETTSTGVNQQ